MTATTTSKLLAVLLLFTVVHAQIDDTLPIIKRSDFDPAFLFGAGTSASQFEGAYDSEGKSPSVWDKFLEENPRAFGDASANLKVAVDGYNRYIEDLNYVKELGLNAYRFSIAWTRILPNGSLAGGINQQGVDHYNKIIDKLIADGIKPLVLLLHFDYPQVLEDRYSGPLSREFVKDFTDYADFIFKTFGDRVKLWMTINEPEITATYGYDFGLGPQARCSNRKRCKAGDSATEPYISMHNFILAHANAVKLYRDKYQKQQGGEIGISFHALYYEPYSNTPDDIEATRRARSFEVGWLLKPLVAGEYPNVMRDIVKDRLPTFTREEKKLVIGSYDFLGLNYYSAQYIKSVPPDPNGHSLQNDKAYDPKVERDGIRFGGLIAAGNESPMNSFPKGLEKILHHLKENYHSPTIIIAENGFPQMKNNIDTFERQLRDQERIDFILKHLNRTHTAIKKGVKVKGYFYWSLTDAFEFLGGYRTEYGLYQIDYNNNLARIPRDSAVWMKIFLKGA